MPFKARVTLLEMLGFGVDSDGFVTENGKRVVDKYVNIEVNVDRLAIAPNGTLILDDNPVSLAGYMEEYEVSIRGD